MYTYDFETHFKTSIYVDYLDMAYKYGYNDLECMLSILLRFKKKCCSDWLSWS